MYVYVTKQWKYHNLLLHIQSHVASRTGDVKQADGAIDICCGNQGKRAGRVRACETDASYKINEIIKTTIWADKEYVK